MSPPLATFEDSELIRLALAGQSECFAALIDRHLAAVRGRIALMVGNAADVDDLLQEVLLKVWRHLSTFRSESTFRTWMTRVAINEALQLCRQHSRSRVRQALGSLDAFAAPGESPYQSVARIEVAKSVRSAVAGLPQKYRQVLILRDMEELSTGETAESLHSTVPAVKTRLFRARLLLSAALKREEYGFWKVKSQRKAARLLAIDRKDARMTPRADSDVAVWQPPEAVGM